MPVKGSRRQQAIEIEMKLGGLGLSKDVIVVTPEEFAACRDVVGSIAYPAAHEGHVVYERTTIELPSPALTLQELLAMAHDEPVVLRTLEGEEYVIGAIEDFQHEVKLMRANPALMRLLDERSREPANISLDSLRPRSS